MPTSPNTFGKKLIKLGIWVMNMHGMVCQKLIRINWQSTHTHTSSMVSSTSLWAAVTERSPIGTKAWFSSSAFAVSLPSSWFVSYSSSSSSSSATEARKVSSLDFPLRGARHLPRVAREPRGRGSGGRGRGGSCISSSSSSSSSAAAWIMCWESLGIRPDLRAFKEQEREKVSLLIA